VARAVAAILERPERTANKYLEVVSFNVSQNEVLKAIAQETGEEWKVEHVDSHEVEKGALESLARGDVGNAFVPMLTSNYFGDGRGQVLPVGKSDNKVLGLAEEDPTVAVKAWLSE
jgi:hypothetical protein